MENSKGHDNKSIEHKVLPTRNLSESALPLKRLPENPTDADNDLRIVGFKVQLDDDQVYSFTLDKTRSKSADILSILACSNEVNSQEVIQVRQFPSEVGRCLVGNPTEYSPTVSQEEALISENRSSGNEYGNTLVLQLTGQQIGEALQVKNESIRDFLNVPMTLEKNEDASSTIRKSEEGFENNSEIELKNNSTCLDKKEFEICIKSKDDSFSSINEQLCFNEDYYEEDKFVEIVKISPDRDGSHYVRYLKGSPTAHLKYSIEKGSREFQTKEESTSAGVQTIDLEVFSSKKLKDTCNQSENAFSSKTQTKMIESVECETTEIFINQAAVYTETETAPVSSQTEVAAIPSIENEYNTSTHVQSTEKVTKKSLDIENLPLYSLMETKPEKVKAEENCRCSCGHKKQHDCIYNCCFHKDGGDIIPASILFRQNLLYLSSIYNTLKCEYCLCRLNISCSETTNNCTEKLKSDVHRQYCCDCGKDASTSVIEAEKAENPENIPENISVKKKNFNSSASKESILRQSLVESFENSEQIKEKEKTCIAVKMPGLTRNETDVGLPESMKTKQKNFSLLASKETNLFQESFEQIQGWDKNNIALKVTRPSEIESIRFLDTPEVIGHCLDSCSLPQCDRPRNEINSIDIKLNAKVLSENIAEEQMKFNLKSTANKNDEEGKEDHHQTLVGGTKKKSAGNNRKLDLYYYHSEVCPCSMCHKKAETTQKIEKGILKNTSSSFQIQKNRSSEIQSRSTSPKIVPENFDYITKDGWKLHNQNSDGFLIKEIKETQIFQFEKASNEECFESFSENLDDACKLVNDHLLSLGSVDEDKVRKAAEILHKRWFQVVGRKYCDVVEVVNFIQYFKEFSNNLVKTLLHSVDNNGNNVLHFAFANNRFDLVDELLKSGYALDLLNKGNKSGNTPLMICAISHPNSLSDWTVVRKCFEFSDVNEKSDKNGQTPLMNAASCGFHNMIDLLLDVRANPNLQDKDGSTALMYAAEHGHGRCVKSLMKHKKCDPTIKDKDGETACSIALSNGHKKIAVLIHMQALEKRRLSQNLCSNERFIFTNNNKAARSETIAMVPVSDLSNENY